MGVATRLNQPSGASLLSWLMCSDETQHSCMIADALARQ
jgi:hypothetical protein